MTPRAEPKLDVYVAPSPTGWPATIMLEECHLPYTVMPIDPAAGDRGPTLIDHDSGLHVVESGAILMYLAEKTGRFMPVDPDGKYDVLQWLFWQVGQLGPMAGELSHFIDDAPGGPAQHAYSHARYKNEYDRRIAVLERVLSAQEFLAGEYSIADIAAWPCVVPHERFEQSLSPYPGVRRWFDALKHRPAVRRGMEACRANL